jgi:phosphatidylglycerol---prolipoprotein diacylglyceryl transferase
VPTLDDPVAITVFGFGIRWYAIFILLGIFVALGTIRWLARRRGYDPEFPLDAAPWVFLAAIIGARSYYVALRWDYFVDHPTEIVNLRLGGLTVHGAIAGGAIALYFICKARGQSFLAWGDLFVAVLPIGQAIGRWGNWANQEAFGTPTDLPWAVRIDPQNRPAQYLDVETFHPTFLYESLLNLVIAAVLIAVVLDVPNRRFWRAGDAIWLYLIMYGAVRLAIESIRTDSLMIGPWPAAYWISGGLIIFGAAMFVVRRTIWPGEVLADQVNEPMSSEAAASHRSIDSGS